MFSWRNNKNVSIFLLKDVSYLNVGEPKNLFITKFALLKSTLLLIWNVWAKTWENVPFDVCTQRRLTSACASAQSDQSIRCPHEETLQPSADSDQTARMCRLIWIFAGRTCPKVRFLMLRLISEKAHADTEGMPVRRVWSLRLRTSVDSMTTLTCDKGTDWPIYAEWILLLKHFPQVHFLYTGCLVSFYYCHVL